MTDMTDSTTYSARDLTGTASDRADQLLQLGDLPMANEWLRRQLESTLAAWANDETTVVLYWEAKADF